MIAKKQKSPDRRKGERFPLEVPIELSIEAKVVSAHSLDMSESGLRFETDEPIPVVLRMKLDGLDIERRAVMAWAHKTAKGSIQYGLDSTGGDIVAKSSED